MSRLYLEITEKLTQADADSGRPLMKMKVEVTDKAAGLGHLPILEPFFAKRSYSKRLHTCNHDIGAPCTTEEL